MRRRHPDVVAPAKTSISAVDDDFHPRKSLLQGSDGAIGGCIVYTMISICGSGGMARRQASVSDFVLNVKMMTERSGGEFKPFFA